MSVVKLSDVAGGFPMENGPELAAFAKDWIDEFSTADYEKMRSIVVIVETTEGNVCLVSQSLKNMDRARLIGLLTIAAHEKIDGFCNIQDIEAKG